MTREPGAADESWRTGPGGSRGPRRTPSFRWRSVAALAVVLVLLGKAQSTLVRPRPRARRPTGWRRCWKRVRAPVAASTAGSASIGEIFSVYQENLRLKDENARLRQWRNVGDRAASDRVKRYQLLLHAVPDPELSSVLARVIGRANRPFLQTMILDAGDAQQASSRARR